MIDIDTMKDAIRKEREERKNPQPRLESIVMQGLEDTVERNKSEKKVETEFFRHITIIYDQAASAGRQVLKRQEISKIDYGHGRAPVSLECENTSIPDCNLVLATSTSCKEDTDVYYCDVFATCEFMKEKSAKDVYEVRISRLMQSLSTEVHL
jgi:hypothetical protein